MITYRHNESRKFTVIYFTHYAKLYGANKSLIALIQGIKNIDNNFFPLVIVSEEGPFTNKLSSLSIPYIIIPFYNCITDVSKINNV